VTPAELELVTKRIEVELRTKVRRHLVQLTADCLGSQGVTFLSALGVDGNAKLLEIFKDEATKLLSTQKENADAKP
jgi:hypothetical protein